MPVHSKAFIKKAIDLRHKGLTARQIAGVLNSEYEDYTGKKLTKNSIIGLWNRNKWYNPISPNKPKPRKRVDFAAILEDTLSKKRGDKFRIRKCLSCGENKVIEKPMFICPICKTKKSYRSASSLGDYTYHG
jgi:hypothetical protein